MPRTNGFGFEIVLDNGQVLPEYSHNGQSYVAAPDHRNYNIRPVIPSWSRDRRYLLIGSVDGLSIMTGKDATGTPDDGGYILELGNILNIPGFTLNNMEVARFLFGERRDAYASQMGKPRNVGVIGVAFYSEMRPLTRAKAYMRVWDDLSLESSGLRGGDGLLGGGGVSRGGSSSRGGLSKGLDMGTEFGNREQFETRQVRFEAETRLHVFTLRYASRESLVDAGVIHETGSPFDQLDAFPGSQGCTPPPNWRR